MFINFTAFNMYVNIKCKHDKKNRTETINDATYNLERQTYIKI